jgi:hypothetical protein
VRTLLTCDQRNNEFELETHPGPIQTIDETTFHLKIDVREVEVEVEGKREGRTLELSMQEIKTLFPRTEVVAALQVGHLSISHHHTFNPTLISPFSHLSQRSSLMSPSLSPSAQATAATPWPSAPLANTPSPRGYNGLRARSRTASGRVRG